MIPDKRSVLRFLKARWIGVLATLGPDAWPQAATVYYCVDDDFNVYFLTRRSTRKFANIGRHARVSFVVGTTQVAKEVQLEGMARRVRSMEERMKIMRIVAKDKRLSDLYRYADTMGNPFQRFPGHDLAIMVIKPTSLRYLDTDPKTDLMRFTQIIPPAASR